MPLCCKQFGVWKKSILASKILHRTCYWHKVKNVILHPGVSTAVWGPAHRLWFRTEHVQPVCPLSGWSPPESQVSSHRGPWYSVTQCMSSPAAGVLWPEFDYLLLMVSIEGRELVIRDLGNSFINHQWTQVWNQVRMKLPYVFILDPPTTWIKISFLLDSRSYEFWRLSTLRSVWIPPAPTLPLPPSTSTTHMSELPCTSAPRPLTGSSAGNAAQQTWAILKPAVPSYVSCHQAWWHET